MNRVIPLGEIAEIKTGPFGTQFKASEYTDRGVPIINVKNIGYGFLNVDDLDHVGNETVERLSEHVLKKGDIIFGRKGSVDRHCIIRDREDGWIQGSDCIRVRIIDKTVNPLYVSYYLGTKAVKNHLSNAAVGSTMPSMNSQIIKELVINAPDLLTQEKIAGFMELIYQKISCNEELINETEELINETFGFWFFQFDFPDCNGKPYRSSGGKMVWNDELQREIPAGWKVKPIGELFSTNRGVSYNSASLEGDGVPMINLASFTPSGAYKVDGIKNYSGEYSEEKVLQPFDLVMCNTQQTAIDFSKDIIGRALLVPDIFEGDIVSSHHVNTIRTDNEDMKFFLYRLFNTDHFHRYISGYANGTNILGLVFDGVEQYISEIPGENVLKKFAELSLAVERKKSELILENQELASLRDFLLPLLMNGQVGFKEG